MSDRPVRVRIGPSPTGEPHVGTAYIALFNLAFAKKHGGKFVLRVEDTDQERSKPEWEAQIMEGLRWLNLQWDEGPDVGGPYGPYRQSERKAIYAEHAQILLDKGHAYRCFATPEELEAKRQEIAAANGDRSAASRIHRDLPAETVARYLAEGRPYVLRMKTPLAGKVTVQDFLRGPVEIDASQLDDQILMKSDGFPTYHLANVVDDYLMGISHVIRAEEWISSTPKHVLLYDMFGWQKPTFVHMPLLRNQDKTKISKRKNPVSIMDYKQRGYLPEALLNYLGMMGFTMPDGREMFSFDEFVEALELSRIVLGGPVFDLTRLSWLNGKYLRERLDERGLVEHLKAAVFSDAYLAKVAPLFKERIDVAEQFVDMAGYFFVGDVNPAPADLVPKKASPVDLFAALEAYAQLIDTQVDFRPEALEAATRAFAETSGVKAKDLFMVLRVALTGRTASPPLFDVMSVLDRALVRRRLRTALGLLKPLAAEARKAAAPKDAPAAKDEARAPAKGEASAPAQGEAPSKKEKKPAGYPVETIEGVGEVYGGKLTAAGCATTEDLLDRAATPAGRKALAEATGISDGLVLKFANMADLMRIKGVAGEYAQLLEAAGVDTVMELARRNPEHLAEALAQINAEKSLAKKVPHVKGVEAWVERAKSLPRRLEY
ncbi:MAG: glutamate--tRNA ligase [Myxococcales bacterium]|nr:glutamate--tRNA ligase [Myxococcales bacterium]MCB9646310.1 glutamate--tRNA ligase [Deltaproteobacteria bacterium]